MKRIIAIVLSLVMLCMLFGCTEKQETAQNGTVNLKIYQLGTKPDDWAEVEAAFNKLALEDIGVTTTWEFIPSGWTKTLRFVRKSVAGVRLIC